MVSPAQGLIAKELMEIKKAGVPFVIVGAHMNDSFKWKGTLIGPKGTPYNTHAFQFEVLFP